MIREEDLQEAIAECEGQRNPNANTCIKLAAYYTIKKHMYGGESDMQLPTYSFSGASTVEYNSGSEFSDIINGKDVQEIFPVIDELMDTLKLMLPRLYDGVMNKLR